MLCVQLCLHHNEKFQKQYWHVLRKNDWEANQAICVSSEFEKYI